MDQFVGKVAVIIGGTSWNGFATAKALGLRRVHLVLSDIEAMALEKAVTQLAETGVKVEGVVCDVANLSEMQRLADLTFQKMGAVHIVFNNAGVAVGGPIVEMK